MPAGLRRTALLVPAVCVGLALALAACGGSDVTTLSAPPTTDTSLTLTLQHSPVGPILATGGGNTVYDFVPDTPTHSACVGDPCVLQWPPLLQQGPVRVGQGVDPSLVGTLRRARRVGPALLRWPPALHVQLGRHAGHGDRSGVRSGRRALVRRRRPGPPDHDGLHRQQPESQRQRMKDVLKRGAGEGELHDSPKRSNCFSSTSSGATNPSRPRRQARLMLWARCWGFC